MFCFALEKHKQSLFLTASSVQSSIAWDHQAFMKIAHHLKYKIITYAKESRVNRISRIIRKSKNNILGELRNFTYETQIECLEKEQRTIALEQ